VCGRSKSQAERARKTDRGEVWAEPFLKVDWGWRGSQELDSFTGEMGFWDQPQEVIRLSAKTIEKKK